MTPHERALEAAYKQRFDYNGKGDVLEACINEYIRTLLDSPEMVERLSDIQANGWEHGTHPQEKAMRIIAAIKKEAGCE
jgi:hypothetical protein